MILEMISASSGLATLTYHIAGDLTDIQNNYPSYVNAKVWWDLGSTFILVLCLELGLKPRLIHLADIVSKMKGLDLDLNKSMNISKNFLWSK